jgi:hypothetical protein
VPNQDNEFPHPIPHLATFELTKLRTTLENYLAQTNLPPGSPPRKVLRTRLRAVIAEQDERDIIRRGAGTHA